VRAPERLFDSYAFEPPEEALASTDRPDYVIKHLGELLPASETHRSKAWNSEGRGD
jgi:hypothetical protein